jgi:hypothetical protein
MDGAGPGRGGAGLVGPTHPGGPPPGAAPPAGRRPSGRLIGIGAAVATALVVLVVSIVVVANSGDGPPGPIATGAGSGTSTPRSSSTYDDAFTSTALRNYVRPFYDDITSCVKTTTGTFASVRCTFSNDVQAALFEIAANISVTELRAEVDNLLSDADKTTWAHGEVWTTTSSGGPTLYWDDTDKRVAAIAVLPGGDLSTLRTWWQSSFGND